MYVHVCSVCAGMCLGQITNFQTANKDPSTLLWDSLSGIGTLVQLYLVGFKVQRFIFLPCNGTSPTKISSFSLGSVGSNSGFHTCNVSISLTELSSYTWGDILIQIIINYQSQCSSKKHVKKTYGNFRIYLHIVTCWLRMLRIVTTVLTNMRMVYHRDYPFKHSIIWKLLQRVHFKYLHSLK